MMCQKIIPNPRALKFHSNLPNLFAKNYQPQLLCSNKNFKHYSAADGGNTFMRSDFTHEHVMEHRGQPGKVNFHHFFVNLIQLIKFFLLKFIPTWVKQMSQWKFLLMTGFFFGSGLTTPILIYLYHYRYTPGV